MTSSMSVLTDQQQQPTEKRGSFIVFEGIDRSGKTTQSQKWVQRQLARGRTTVWMRFPNYETGTGPMLRSYLQGSAKMDDRAQHLLFCTNRAECVATIVKLLNQGTDVVCDRYVFSGIAYSVAKGLSIKWCKDVEVGMPKPDAVVHLCIDPSIAAKRADFGTQLHDNLEFLRKVTDVYGHLRLSECTNICVNANQTPDEVAKEIDLALAVVDTGKPLGVFEWVNR